MNPSFLDFGAATPSVLIDMNEANGTLPLVIQATQSQPLLDWAQLNADTIRSVLTRHGAILFRDFVTTGVDSFQQFIELVSGPLIPYNNRGTPRRQVKGRIYSSTELAPQLRVFMHNENTFAPSVPGHLFFYCIKPAKQGGSTPLADVRKVLARLDPTIRRRFREKQVLYVRNFGQGLGMRWEDAFQTRDREELEVRCRHDKIAVDWLDDKRVRIRQQRPALARHPQTGEEVWLNQAAVLHVSTLEPELQTVLLKLFDEADLPNNTYYGDGQPIEPEVLDAVRDAYVNETTRFDWQARDVLALDNLLVAHGRDSYVGDREIVVGMTNNLPWKAIGIAGPS
jgi:alpha-ketoglutarate-dependent taurine dioxygenase